MKRAAHIVLGEQRFDDPAGQLLVSIRNIDQVRPAVGRHHHPRVIPVAADHRVSERAWAPSPIVAKLLSWSISGRPSALARSTARKPSGSRLAGVSLQRSWATRCVRFDRTAAPDQLCRDGGCRSHCRGHVSLPSEHGYAGDRLDSQRAFPQRQTGRRECLSKGRNRGHFRFMQQNQEPTTLLRIGTMTAVAGRGLLALIWLFPQLRHHLRRACALTRPKSPIPAFSRAMACTAI
jgi:hypothetical protein